MKNLIRGHVYQLKKDIFFLGCLAISVIFLIISIRSSLSSAELDPIMGINSFVDTFLDGDIILYAFMLLTANIVAESYRSGAIKNIIGRGIEKKKYYMSIVFTISAVYLLIMLISGIVVGVISFSKFGMGSFSYTSYYVLSMITRILFVIAHISFVVTMTIITKNTIIGFILGFVIPNIPKIVEMVLGFLKIRINLDFLKISTHMPNIYEASNNLSSFLPCFVVLIGYLVLSIVVGFKFFEYQDIK